MGVSTILLSFIVYLLVSSHSSACEAIKPAGRRTIVVDANGSGDFRSVQAAVDSIPDNNTKRVVLQIKAGHYIEKVIVPATKTYVTFLGAGQDSTVIEWHGRTNGQQLRTYGTASVTVFANYFSARNISFKNIAPAPMADKEAAAFRISGDKAYFYECGFYGAEGTLFDDAGRHYFKSCYIEGSIDFIFGNGRSMYKDCQLHSIAKSYHGSIAAQARTNPREATGFAFVNCKVTGGGGRIYVGRAMGQYSRIVFAYTYFDNVIAPGGWDVHNLDHQSNQITESRHSAGLFGVYRCWGPGAAAVRGVSWARELDYETARPFLVKSFVNGRHWLNPLDV